MYKPSNPFLLQTPRDIDTGIIYDKAIVCDLDTTPACTDGSRLFLNTEENLEKIFPAYNKDMCKWLLWHEKFHISLGHHRRYEALINSMETLSLTASEVNIIMDILVHDSLAKMFPDIVETARLNCAQMRDSNSLMYTFKGTTLEDMIQEYDVHKKKQGDNSEQQGDNSEQQQEGDTNEQQGDNSEQQQEGDTNEQQGDNSEQQQQDDNSEQQQQGEGSTTTTPTSEEENTSGEENASGEEQQGRHHEIDWSKLQDQDNPDREFITPYRAGQIIAEAERLDIRRIKIGNLTHTINSLATTTRERTYCMPSHIHTGSNILFKGYRRGKTALYLCFDASGSMQGVMDLFKSIIQKSIPQALTTPTRWFSGYTPNRSKLAEKDKYDYYYGTFRDFLQTNASSGYYDDGDRTIEMCFEAEKQGYSPIGVTDGGYHLDWAKPMLKQLKRTVIVTTEEKWADRVKEVNPNIQIIVI